MGVVGSSPTVGSMTDYTHYVKEDGSIGKYMEVKYGRTWWKLIHSKIVPFWYYGEERELKLDDYWLKVRFTREGWLEQEWKLETEYWSKKVTEEEYTEICQRS